MARPHAEEEKPLDPDIDKMRRRLVRFMGINLGLLFLALMVVVGALVYKARHAAVPTQAAGDIESPPGAPTLTGDIVLPVGARIISQSVSGNRLSIDAELDDGSRAIFVYDMAGRHMVGRFAVRNK
jgi:hypothetical protein